MSANYLDELNENQRAAVLYNDGPSLVIAGAGSGKTRVLTYKIAYLLESGYQPWNILALTFTNKAAREMKERIARQVGEKRARYLWMGTFHSLFSRILRSEADYLGFNPHFTIYDTSDSKSLIRTIIKDMELDEKVYKPGSVQARISNAKNRLITPAVYANTREVWESDSAAKMPEVHTIYRIYWERLKQSGAMDFDDLLFYTYILFRDFPEILEKYRDQFRFILVDEYQDTNFAQHQIVQQLSGRDQRIAVVGDDAQSIYSFRGANINNILNFTSFYKEAKIFKLEQNYRSTQCIVCAANSLIEKNRRQIRKNVFSEKEQGEPLGIFQAYSDVEEGDIVANKIGELRLREHYEYSDFAILYRTNAQSRIFEEALRKRGLPYKIYGGLSFYQRKEIKDIIAYFRLVVNPDDEEAFKRIINYPARGIGQTTLAKIGQAAAQNRVSLWQVITDPVGYGLVINKGTQGKLQFFRELIESFAARTGEENAYQLATDIVKGSGIINEIYQNCTPENLSSQENIEELMNGIYEFCSMREEEGNNEISLIDFLSEVSLLTDMDTDKENEGPKITLMTVHAAKGLEFKNVFVVGLEENLFPSIMVSDSPRAMEEERRLFYVAITRAEEHCYLSYAKTRFRYGKMEFGSPSRFLHDIDVQFLQLPQEVLMARQVEERAGRVRSEQNRQPKRSYQKEENTFRRPSPAVCHASGLKKVSSLSGNSGNAGGAKNNSSLQAGQRIEHERFGIGEVIRIEGAGENTKATVRFKNAGEKQLLLRFARFTIIE
ncbi:MAG: UvrD-helicase domain-containing protein [Bacteroides sp.]|nr:UvrD-helicase domain-containing protein [Bacteroides sp.]